MSDSIQIGAVVDPSSLSNEITYSSDNSSIGVNNSGVLYSTDGNDADVVFTGHVRSVNTQPLNMKIVSVSDFKYDLLTLDYDRDIFSIERDTSGNTCTLSVQKVGNSTSNVICNIYYPVSLDMNIEVVSGNVILEKVDDECIYQLRSNGVLQTGLLIEVTLRLSLKISKLNTYIFDGGNAIDD